MAEQEKESTALEKLLSEIAKEAESRLARNQFQAYPDKAWWNRTRDLHMIHLLSSLRLAAIKIMDDKEFRQGLLGAAADITIALRRHDEAMEYNRVVNGEGA